MSEEQPAGLLRRLAIILYDALLLVAVLFLATTPLVFVNHGEAVDYSDPWIAVAAQAYFVGVAYLYFGWFWTQGQTLGMRAWRTHLVDREGRSPTWLRALARFLLSIVSWLPAGLGFWWSLYHPQRAGWHDIGSGTRLVVRARASRLAQATHQPNPKDEKE